MGGIRIISSVFYHCAAGLPISLAAFLNRNAQTIASGQKDVHLLRGFLTAKNKGRGFGCGCSGRAGGEAGSECLLLAHWGAFLPRVKRCLKCSVFGVQ
jgi:hypothetical protein